MQPVVGHAQIKAGVSEMKRGHIGFDEFDRILHAPSARLPTRPLEHVRRDVGRDILHGLAGTQTAEGQATPARDVEYRGVDRNVGKSLDVGEHAAQVGAPHRPGAELCDTGVLDAGVVEGRCDAFGAPFLGYVGHQFAAVSGASQGIDAETQWVSSCWSLLCKCRGGVTNVAYGRQRTSTRPSCSATALTAGRSSAGTGSPDMRSATAIITSIRVSSSSSITASQ